MMMPMDPRNPHSSRSGQTPGVPSPLIDSMTMRPARRTRRGNPVVPPDPGTARSRLVAVLLSIVLGGTAIVWQNLGHDRQQVLINAPPPAPIVELADEPAPGGMTTMLAKVYLRLEPVLKADPNAGAQIADILDTFAATDADRVRGVIADAEFVGPDSALRRIDALEREILTRPPGDDISDDAAPSADGGGEGIVGGADGADAALDAREASNARDALVLDELRILRTIYTRGPGALDDESRERMIDRYGDLGRFALSWGQPEPDRRAILGAAWPVFVLGLVLLLLFGLGLLAGFGVLVWGIAWYTSPRTTMRCPRPEPGGSVLLETYALFVGCFALMAIGTTIAEAYAPAGVRDVVRVVQLPAQWLLLLTVFWPLARGMNRRAWRQAVGLTRGAGVAREMGCGALVYLACLPLYLAGALVTVVLMILWEMARERMGIDVDPAPVSNPIIDMLGSGDPLVVIMIFTLATVWAPITEELIFRGALYRHFRGRVHWVLAALGTALLFAYMHSYGPLMVAPLVALGFMFAFMREWRGSIIASMTAHFLHNFTLLTMVLVMLGVVG